MGVKILGVHLLRKRSDRADLISAWTEWKLPIIVTMNNLWKASLHQATQSRMTTPLGLLKSGKQILRHTSDRGDLMKFLGEWYEKFELVSHTRKFFSMNRAICWERGKTSWPIIGTTWYQFSRIGKASTICHWKGWSRIGIVSRINIIRESGEWSGAKKTEANFKCYRRWRETFYDLVNVHDCNYRTSSIHEKELPEQLSIHRKHERSHTQTNVRHVYKIGVWARWDLWIGWENHSWKYLSLICDERIMNLRRTKVYFFFFSDFVLCLGKIFENPESHEAWEQRLGWIKSFQNYINFDRNDGEPMEFEWNIFPRFNSLQLSEEVKRKLLRRFHRKNSKSMFSDISCASKDNEQECLANVKTRFSVCKKIWKRTMVIYWSWFCKHYTSNTAKSYVKWLRWKQRLRWKLWEQVCDELQHRHKRQVERRVQQAAHQARHQWRWHIAPALQRTRGVHAPRLHASSWWHRTPHSASSEHIHSHPWSSTWCTLFDSTSPFSLWENHSWRQLSLIGDETVINLQGTKVYGFSDSVLCLGRILQLPESNEAWKNRVAGDRSEKSYRD